MSVYVLDTDILSLYQFGNAAVCQRVAGHFPGELHSSRLAPRAVTMIREIPIRFDNLHDQTVCQESYLNSVLNFFASGN